MAGHYLGFEYDKVEEQENMTAQCKEMPLWYVHGNTSTPDVARVLGMLLKEQSYGT